MPADLGISRPNAADEVARQDALVAAARRPEREYESMGVEELRNEIAYRNRLKAALDREIASLQEDLDRQLSKEPANVRRPAQ